ncbi:MAG: hypothetical protein HYY17_11785 [Planctomycetes bacterium]|nr:hypothetical protein [Planctomycetota bacterium]
MKKSKQTRKTLTERDVRPARGGVKARTSVKAGAMKRVLFGAAAVETATKLSQFTFN